MNKLLRSMLALTGVIAGGSSAAQAANVSHATLPYEFMANGVKMPAGKYRVENLPGVVRLMELSSGSIVVLPHQGVRTTGANRKTHLIMKRAGSTVHLVAVREGNSSRLRVLDTQNF